MQNLKKFRAGKGDQDQERKMQNFWSIIKLVSRTYC